MREDVVRPPHWALAFRVAKRRGVPTEDAEDIAGEAVARLFKKQRAGVDVGNADAFVVRITNNLCTDWWRRRKRVQSWERMMRAAPPPSADSAEDIFLLKVGRARKVEWVQSELDKHTPHMREIFELHHGQEMKPHEIAEVLGTTPGAVRQRIHRLHKIVRMAREQSVDRFDAIVALLGRYLVDTPGTTTAAAVVIAGSLFAGSGEVAAHAAPAIPTSAHAHAHAHSVPRNTRTAGASTRTATALTRRAHAGTDSASRTKPRPQPSQTGWQKTVPGSYTSHCDQPGAASGPTSMACLFDAHSDQCLDAGPTPSGPTACGVTVKDLPFDVSVVGTATPAGTVWSCPPIQQWGMADGGSPVQMVVTPAVVERSSQIEAWYTQTSLTTMGSAIPGFLSVEVHATYIKVRTGKDSDSEVGFIDEDSFSFDIELPCQPGDATRSVVGTIFRTTYSVR